MQDDPQPSEETTYQGAVSDDPAAAPLPTHTKISFLAQIFQFAGHAGEYDTNDLRSFKGILLHLNIQTPSGPEFHIEGSATLLGCGVAVTATHTLTPYLERLSSGSMLLMCVGVLNESLILWHCHSIAPTSNPDLTILILTLRSEFPEGLQFYIPAVSAFLPNIGSTATIAGFRAEAPNGLFLKDAGQVNAKGRLKISRGPVTAVYPIKRDNHQLPWPCIEVDTPTSGGVSGGPVFSEEGFLIGILCSSLLYEDGAGTSYASLIWPALLPQISIDWPRNAYPAQQSLFKSVAIVLEGRECFVQPEDSDIVQVRLMPRPEPAKG